MFPIFVETIKTKEMKRIAMMFCLISALLAGCSTASHYEPKTYIIEAMGKTDTINAVTFQNYSSSGVVIYNFYDYRDGSLVSVAKYRFSKAVPVKVIIK